MAAEAARRNVRFLDAPVSGSAPLAAEGKLTFWIGGEGADLEEVRSLLLYMGNRITHLGPHGSGSAMKLVVNLLLGAGMAAFAEATVLAEGMGLPVRVVFDSLAGMPQIAASTARRSMVRRPSSSPERFCAALGRPNAPSKVAIAIDWTSRRGMLTMNVLPTIGKRRHNLR
jgi:3-hydroxyisobutyrate dehydrogenase-like beta-hydroxyacid dehydrogenase